MYLYLKSKNQIENWKRKTLWPFPFKAKTHDSATAKSHVSAPRYKQKWRQYLCQFNVGGKKQNNCFLLQYNFLCVCIHMYMYTSIASEPEKEGLPFWHVTVNACTHMHACMHTHTCTHVRTCVPASRIQPSGAQVNVAKQLRRESEKQQL